MRRSLLRRSSFATLSGNVRGANAAISRYAIEFKYLRAGNGEPQPVRLWELRPERFLGWGERGSARSAACLYEMAPGHRVGHRIIRTGITRPARAAHHLELRR